MAAIRERSNNVFEIRVSCGYTVDGHQKMQQKTWKADPNMTVKQIEKELNRQTVLFEESCKKGQITAAVKFQSFAEQWFTEYARINLRSTSYERMRQLTKRTYLAIGHLRLDKVSGRHIQQFVNGLLQDGQNQRTGGKLARKTVVHYLSFISDVFSYAVKIDMLNDNPCKKVTIPKAEKREKEVYTLEEIGQLFELLESAPLKYRLFFNMIIYTGFRRSEMLGLEWKDIDWDNNVIHVRRTSNYTAERGIYTDTTKTKKSQRSRKYPQRVFDLLREYQAEQNEERERIGDKWVNTDRIFVKWDGKAMNNQTMYGWLKEFCAENDFPFRGLHIFRHNHASILINAGVDVVTVSGAMGHSDINTTLGIYCHEFASAQAKTCEIIANALDFTKEAGDLKDNSSLKDTVSA